MFHSLVANELLCNDQALYLHGHTGEVLKTGRDTLMRLYRSAMGAMFCLLVVAVRGESLRALLRQWPACPLSVSLPPHRALHTLTMSKATVAQSLLKNYEMRTSHASTIDVPHFDHRLNSGPTASNAMDLQSRIHSMHERPPFLLVSFL